MLPGELTDWYAYYRIKNGGLHDTDDEALDLTDEGAQAELLAAFGGMKQSGLSVRIDDG